MRRFSTGVTLSRRSNALPVLDSRQQYVLLAGKRPAITIEAFFRFRIGAIYGMFRPDATRFRQDRCSGHSGGAEKYNEPAPVGEASSLRRAFARISSCYHGRSHRLRWAIGARAGGSRIARCGEGRRSKGCGPRSARSLPAGGAQPQLGAGGDVSIPHRRPTAEAPQAWSPARPEDNHRGWPHRLTQLHFVGDNLVRTT